jgi:hypothetical protein
MAKASPTAAPPRAAPRSRWEANCLFCSEAIPDEGEGFLRHIAREQPCRDAYAGWRGHLDEDRLGG